MKQLNQYINEKFKISSKNVNKYNPKDREELKDLVNKLIKERGTDADLNDIDTSEITDMHWLFKYYSKFNGDISNWDVSNVKYMYGMFEGSKFNGDISNWNVSNVENMNNMFYNSTFNGNISKWDVSNVKNMEGMFYYCYDFNSDLSNWDVSNVTNMRSMFQGSKFDGDISNWDVSNVKDMVHMFVKCPLEKNPPKWYKD